MNTDRAATRLTITDTMRSPKLLGESFRGPSWHRWLSALKAAYAEPMDADELSRIPRSGRAVAAQATRQGVRRHRRQRRRQGCDCIVDCITCGSFVRSERQAASWRKGGRNVLGLR